MRHLSAPPEKRRKSAGSVFLGVGLCWAGLPGGNGVALKRAFSPTWLLEGAAIPAPEEVEVREQHGRARPRLSPAARAEGGGPGLPPSAGGPRPAHVRGSSLPAEGRRGQWAGRVLRLRPMVPRFSTEFRCQG